MTPDIKTLRALVDAATPGPWRAISGKGSATVQANECAVYINVSREGVMHPDTIARWQADARFIAAARSALPALLDEVERLRGERDAAFADAMNQHHEGGPARRELRLLKVEHEKLKARIEQLERERDAARRLAAESTARACGATSCEPPRKRG